MQQTRPRPSRVLPLAFMLGLLQAGCGGGGGGGGDGNGVVPPDNITGDAILDVQVVDGVRNSTPPAPPPGFSLLNIDLNEGTGGNYIWLYYKLGKADGSDGVPVSRIYTVDEFDGEAPQGGEKLPVNLNVNAFVTGGHEPLWLYQVKANWPVARCVVVDNKTKGKRVYGPPEAEGKYPVVWVQRILSNSVKSPYPDLPPDAQDLNEGQSSLITFPFTYISDYIYIGYCKD